MPKLKKKLNLDEIRSLHGGYWRYKLLDYHYLYNHYFPTRKLVARLQKKLPELIDNYPSTHRVIAKLLARWESRPYFNENNLIIGNGSSELIRVMNQIMDRITVPIPTFNEWVQLPKERLNLFFTDEKKKFKIDIDKLIYSANKSQSNFIVVNNPNNPVGNVLDRNETTRLLKTKKIIVVDEAFVDFCPQVSVEDLISQYQNLVVIKSCSKSMGFPGLRLGYLLTSNGRIKEEIKKFLPIWNINALTEYFIEIFPEFEKDYQESIRKTLEDKEDLFEKLKKISYLEPYESFTNFIFCKTRVSGRKLTEVLYNKYNLLVKDGLNQDILKSDCYIRIGVKTREENDLLIKVLKEGKMFLK